ncbi:MAG: hypothetical protein KBT01_09050, partial [Clostridiales bacterium]|nr:hypothetical protein [Candidatus Blautia equi]
YLDGKLDKSIILFGIPVLKVIAWLKNRKKKKEEPTAELPGPVETPEEISEETVPETVTVVETEAEQKPEPELKPEPEPEPEPIPEPEPEPVKPEAEKPEQPAQKKAEKKTEKKPDQIKDQTKEKKAEKKKAPKKSPVDKLNDVIAKIRNAIINFEETKAKLTAMAEEWKEFLGHKKTKAAIKLVFRMLGKMLKHIIPTKMSGDVTFGSDNPSLMGNVLAVVGMTIPLHKNSVRLHPLFNEGNVITGDLKLKGRIRIGVFVGCALRIVISRNIWFVINHFRKKKKQEG